MQRLMAIICALGMLYPGYLRASETVSLNLEGALRACDVALTKCDQALKDKNEVIDAQAGIILKQTQAISDLQSQRDSVWRSPALWVTIGVVAGALTMIGSAALVKEINR